MQPEIGEGKLVIVARENEIFSLTWLLLWKAPENLILKSRPILLLSIHAEGMCLDCLGLGYQYGANLTQKPEIMDHSALSLMRLLWQGKIPVRSHALV